MITRLALAFLFAFAASTAWATDAYVSTTGSGSACTSGSPCGTITAAAAVVTAGGFVNVAPGTYSLASFTTTVAGTSGNVITYRCATAAGVYKRGECKFIPPNGTANSTIFWENQGQYVTIKGFEFDGRGLDGSTWRIALYASPTNSGAVTIEENVIHHIFQVPISECNSSGGSGITTDAFNSATAHVNILSNWVHDIGPPSGCNTTHGIYSSTASSGTNQAVKNNVVYRAAGWGITTWHDANRMDITNNTVFNNTSGGISLGAGGWYKGAVAGGGGINTNATTSTSSAVLNFTSNATNLSNVQVGWGAYNATNPASVGATGHRVTAVNAGAGTVTLHKNADATVQNGDTIEFGPLMNNSNTENNLIANNSNNGIVEYGSTGTSNVYAYNLIYNSGTACALLNSLTCTNQVTSDPLFVNYVAGGGGDYRLQSGSPARGAGVSTRAPSTDFWGLSRGTTYDIGAFRYSANPVEFALSAGRIQTDAAYVPNTLMVGGWPLGIDNAAAQINLRNGVTGATGAQKWIRLGSAGSLDMVGTGGLPILSLQDEGAAAIGPYATTRGLKNVTCSSAAQYETVGSAQTCQYRLRTSATSTTAVRLTADGGAAGATNCVNIPFTTSAVVRVMLIATNMTTRGKEYSWVMPNALLTKDTTLGSTALSNGSAVTATRGTVTGSSVSMTADTTNGCINLSWTPPTSNSDTYSVSAVVDTVEARR